MSYVKTQWVNNTTPINDTNLNKIEQGIYDNSLVVDAVTNTLNPTDTETYKTAELTEGQITDVIGVNDIVIKGDTGQDGEPTPSTPVDVNVVSGSNVINTSNKNLLSINNGTFISVYNFNGNVQNGIITVNGTPSSTPGLLRITLSQPIKLKQNDSVKINVNNSNGIGTSSNYVAFRLVGIVNGVSNDNITEVVCTSANANKTFTVTNNTIINQVVVRGNANVTFNNFIIKPQIELGTTTTTYEPHQGKELHLDLGKNLFNEDNYLANTGINSDGTIATSNNNSLFYIPIKYGKKYTISFVDNGVSGNILYGFSNDKPVLNGTCTYNVLDITTLNNHTFTPVNANNKYLCIRLNVVNTNQYQAMENIQVELGSEATKYVSYDPDPIELCKIGNYQDYFYRDNSKGKWYLHKETGKLVLDGSENWSYSSSNLVFYTDVINTLAIRNSNIFCDRFKKVANSTTFANMNNGEIITQADNNVNARLVCKYTNITSAADFKTWLASNNVIVYYVLATATDTEITDTTLISQLEAIYNAPLYEETNITQENNDLPMVLDIIACKDNINGIKAFIRK